MGEMNGNVPQTQQPAQQAPSLDDQLDAQIRQVLGITCRGILVSAPGIGPDKVVCSIARVVAEVIGNSIVGDLSPVLMIRKAAREAFNDKLGKMPIQQVPGQQQPAGPPPGSLRN